MWLCMLYNHNIPPYVLAPTGHCCCVAVKYRGWAPLNSEVHTVPASFKLLSGTDAKVGRSVGRSVYADQNFRVLLAWVPFYMVFLNHIMPLCYFSAFPFCTFSFCSREGHWRRPKSWSTGPTRSSCSEANTAQTTFWLDARCLQFNRM